MIHITIPGKPVPMYRPRVVHFGRRGVRTFNPRVMKNYERYARVEGMAQYKGKPIKDAPIYVEIFVYVPMPQSWSKSKKGHMEGNLVIKRPDLDNYGKDIVDSFNGTLYKDDNLMAKEYLEKRYSIKPRVEFYVKAIK